MALNEKDLVTMIKKSLSDADPTFKLILGREVLSAKDVITRIDNDKEFKKIVITQYRALLGEKITV